MPRPTSASCLLLKEKGNGDVPLLSASLVRMTVRGCRVFVGSLTMSVSRSCVLLGLFVLAHFVMMPRLMVMMRGGGVVSGCLMVVLTRRMLR